MNLDDISAIEKLDPKNVFSSTGMLARQCRQIWDDSKVVEFSEDFSDIENIVLCGMGGSAYGGYVVNSLFKNQLKVPLFSNNDYDLPKFANKNTLIILSSYSGTTEEVLSCAEEAKTRSCKITGITEGGKLREFLKTNNFSSLIFDPKFNPSAQPRLGTGYIVFGTIGILNNLGVINISDSDVEKAVLELESNLENIKDLAKNLARKIYSCIPIVFAAEFLSGNAHILRNQFNETSKSFSSFSLLSELNHHLMEGLKNPADKKLFILFLNSDFYSEILKRRIELTKDVVSQNGVPYEEYKAQGNSKLSQVLNVLSLGGYTSFYLAMLYGQDPSFIPWVDYFKKQLEEQ